MTRRGGSDGIDSLELLLDTVCNVFGGIIFIAILVSLLTSNRTQSVRADLAALITQTTQQRSAAAASARVAALEAGLAEVRKIVGTLDTDPTQRGVRILETITKEQKLADERLTQAQRWFDEYRKLSTRQLADRSSHLEQTKTQVAAAEAERKALQRAQTIRGRLPLERRTQKDQVIVIVRSDRVYPAPIGRGKLPLTRAGLDREVDVRWQGEDRIDVTLIDGAGIRVDERVGDQHQFVALVSAIQPRTHFVDVFVFPDGATAFRQFRDAIADKGFSYNVRPCAGAGKTISFLPTDTVSVQ